MIEFAGETDIFITPGYEFGVIDALLTNFHLPKSTLLMLVSAFAGMQKIAMAYRHAIANDYRFFSYGDACFMTRNPSPDIIASIAAIAGAHGPISPQAPVESSTHVSWSMPCPPIPQVRRRSRAIPLATHRRWSAPTGA